MEFLHGTIEECKFAQEDDVISSMPDLVISNIMNRLPVQDAVRTGILSKSWRYKWTLLNQLVLDDNFFMFLFEQGEETNSEKIISRLLLHIKCVITKFVLDIQEEFFDENDINHWILCLSTKGIQEFTISNMDETPLKLSTHLFSCLQLKHLNLYNCCFDHVPSFCRFPNLLSLVFSRVTFENCTCGEFITQCPLLEILNVTHHDPNVQMKVVEIAKLNNLKKLTLLLCMLEDIVTTSSSIFQLGNHLPKLQELSLDFRHYKFVGEDGGRKWVCNAFPSLKTLTLYQIDFSNGIMLSWAFEMIWGSPCLQTLNIAAPYTNRVPPPAISFTEADHNTLGQLQLRNVVFSYFRGSENEVYLVKCLLASSPLLKTMVIHPSSFEVFGADSAKLTFSTKLLTFRRASPLAEVKLYWT